MENSERRGRGASKKESANSSRRGEAAGEVERRDEFVSDSDALVECSDACRREIQEAAASFIKRMPSKLAKPLPFVYSSNETVEDMDISRLYHLLWVGLSALQDTGESASCPGDYSALSQFIIDILTLGIVERPSELYRLWTLLCGETDAQSLLTGCGNARNHTLSFCNVSRDARLLLHASLGRYTPVFLEWESREYLLELLRYCFCRALEAVIWLSREAALHRPTDINRETESDNSADVTSMGAAYRVADGSVLKVQPVKARRVPEGSSNANTNGLVRNTQPVVTGRESLLIRRGGATVSLDEFATRLIEELDRREQQRSQSKKGAESSESDGSSATAGSTDQEDTDDDGRGAYGRVKNMG